MWLALVLRVFWFSTFRKVLSERRQPRGRGLLVVVEIVERGGQGGATDNIHLVCLLHIPGVPGGCHFLLIFSSCLISFDDHRITQRFYVIEKAACIANALPNHASVHKHQAPQGCTPSLLQLLILAHRIIGFLPVLLHAKTS